MTGQDNNVILISDFGQVYIHYRTEHIIISEMPAARYYNSFFHYATTLNDVLILIIFHR